MGAPPRLTTVGRIFDVLAGYSRLWSQAVELFLKDPELGEALRRKAAVVLPCDDLAAALIKALSLEIAFFVEGDLADFELCFRLPWDPDRSYDVEYEEAQAQRFKLSR